MSKMRFSIVAVGLGLSAQLLGSSLQAAENVEPVLPKLDLGDRSQWIKERVSESTSPSEGEKAEGEKKQRGISSFRTSKKGKFRQLLVTFADGSTAEHWLYGPYIVQGSLNAGNGKARAYYRDIQDKGSDALPGWIKARDLEEFDWIKKSHFVKQQTIDGEVYHYFSAEVEVSGLDDSNKPIKFKKEAWVNPGNALPYRLRVNDELWEYTYSPSQFTMPRLPNSHKAAIAKLEQASRRGYSLPR